MTNIGPAGWSAHNILTRFVTALPRSYDAETRSVDCVVSTGAPVLRPYGTELVKIAKSVINIDRVPWAFARS
jgi:hypothetical protein